MRKLRKPNLSFSGIVPKTRGKKIGIMLLLIVIVLIAVFAVIYFINSPDHQASKKLDKISAQDTSCEQVRKEVGELKVDDKYSVDVQKKILEKQLLCFSDDLQFDKATIAAKQLKTIYDKENNPKDSQRIEANIKSMQSLQQELKSLESN